MKWTLKISKTKMIVSSHLLQKLGPSKQQYESTCRPHNKKMLSLPDNLVVKIVLSYQNKTRNVDKISLYHSLKKFFSNSNLN